MRSFISVVALTLLATMSPAWAQSAPPAVIEVSHLLVCPDDPTLAPASANFSEAGCVETATSEIDPQGRTIWLRARVVLPQHLEQPLALRVTAMASSAVYWNGARVGENGRVGASRAQEIPGLLDVEFYLPPTLLRPGENVLSMRMSAREAPIHLVTPVGFVGIGRFGGLRSGMLRSYLPALIASGAILLGAVFFMASFASDRREASAGLLSLAAVFAVGQVCAEAVRALVAYPYPVQIWRIVGVAACAGLFAIALTAFVVARFKVPRPQIWVGTVAGLVLGAEVLAPAFDAKALLALLIGASGALAVVARPALTNRSGARLTAAGLIAFIVLMLVQPLQFLDRDFYLAVSALLGLLFVDQVLAMGRARAERALAEQRSARLEMELLRRSIEPHFLMNTLNSLAEWIESDPKVGAQMIEALSQHMRALNAIGQRELIPVSEELELVRSYLAIMSYRTDCRFSLSADPPAEVRIPPGVLHTLAENAFSHNRYPAGGEFRLEVFAVEGANQIVFETPPSSERRPRNKGGAGHAYVRGRLAAAFGEGAWFTDGPTEAGSWRSAISLPRSSV